MKENRRKMFLGKLDIALLLFSAMFLFSAVGRICGAEYIDQAREMASDFMMGELSAEHMIRAIGSWENADQSILAVFRMNDEEAVAAVPEQPEVDFENMILSQTMFPQIVDSMSYLVELDCKRPVAGELTSGFGERSDPISGEKGFHYGLDVAAPEGEPICSVASGVVREIGENSYGKYIVIMHENGLQSLYAHCSAINAAVGQRVDAGENIAAVGMTGKATGNHLHFELWRDGKVLDPTAYLKL